MSDTKVIPAKLNRSGANGGFRPVEEATVDHLGNKVAARVLARYQKGADSNGDNLVVVQNRRSA